MKRLAEDDVDEDRWKSERCSEALERTSPGRSTTRQIPLGNYSDHLEGDQVRMIQVGTIPLLRDAEKSAPERPFTSHIDPIPSRSLDC